MGSVSNFVSIMANFALTPENLPSVRLCFGGRGILSSWKTPMRKAELWHIYHNLTPGGQLIFHDKIIDMTPDRIYLIPAFTPFAVSMTTETLEHCYVDFEITGRDFESIEKRLYEFDAEIYAHQLSACWDSGFSALASCSLIFSLLQRIVPHSYRNQLEHPTDNRISQALDIIESSFRNGDFQQLTNQILSKKLGMSVSSFRHLFQKETNVPPQRYILRKKLEHARDLLLSGKLSIEEIAVQTGFGDRYQFTKHFSALFRQSPAKYRKKFQNNLLYSNNQKYNHIHKSKTVEQ